MISTTKRAERRKKSSQVPATYAGFSHQTFRAVVHLVDACPGEVVSVEYLDDVATEGPSRVEVEQSKAGIAKNPIANTSPELWKTIANWLDAVNDGHLDLARTRFVLTVKPGHIGQIAEALSKASDTVAAKAAIDAAKARLAKVLTSKTSRSAARPYLEKIFAADDATLGGLVERFSVVRTSDRVAMDIEAALKTKPISARAIQRVAREMLGWVQVRLQEQYETGHPPAVSADEFLKELTSCVRAVDRDMILQSFGPPPTQEEIEAQLPGRTFIQQLAVIDCTYDELLNAASAYLRAAADRTRWSEDGFVHRLSWDDYEADLKNQWESHRGMITLAYRDRTAEERGKMVLHQCCACKLKVQGAEVPAHFTPGSFHALADREEIGWHPDFKAVLQAARAARRKKAS